MRRSPLCAQKRCQAASASVRAWSSVRSAPLSLDWRPRCECEWECECVLVRVECSRMLSCSSVDMLSVCEALQ